VTEQARGQEPDDGQAGGRDLGQNIGNFIRDLRRNAGVSLRQLADKAGVSNPYLSQVERGLRKPSAEVLQQIAGALRVSTPVMYLRAGLLDAKDREGVLAAIAADPDLTLAQKQSLSQIYETFRRENARSGRDGDQPEDSGPADRDDQPQRPDRPAAHKPIQTEQEEEQP
jgi:transcriptional regulator with XRE-family HTH domain